MTQKIPIKISHSHKSKKNLQKSYTWHLGKCFSLISQKSFQKLSDIHKNPTQLHLKFQNPILSDTYIVAVVHTKKREKDPRLCDDGGMRQWAVAQTDGQPTANISLKPPFSLFNLIQGTMAEASLSCLFYVHIPTAPTASWTTMWWQQQVIAQTENAQDIWIWGLDKEIHG